jgi:hypothetical protein
VKVDADSRRLRILCGKYVETCPWRAFEDWQAVAQRSAGPLFRSIARVGGSAVARCTRTRCAAFFSIGSAWPG